MKNLLLLVFISTFVSGCKKAENELSSTEIPSYKTYIIKKGAHFAEQNIYAPVETSMLKFTVKFDSSAIYTSILPENQNDINKLYGFSDNNENHHQYSARLGWRWSENALRLFAYVYNAGQVSSKEITAIDLGAEVDCYIIVSGANYIFKVGEATGIMPRSAGTVKATGYQLYPYFGGDETAPHDITIRIKDEKQP